MPTETQTLQPLGRGDDGRKGGTPPNSFIHFRGDLSEPKRTGLSVIMQTWCTIYNISGFEWSKVHFLEGEKWLSVPGLDVKILTPFIRIAVC